MNVSKPVLSSLVLLAVSAGMLVPWVLDVNVTNLPLDEQGNLKVTQMNGDQPEPSWKDIIVVDSFNLTWETDMGDIYSDPIDFGIFSTYGYSRIQVYMTVTNYTDVGGIYPGMENFAQVWCNLTKVWQLGDDGTTYAHPPTLTYGWETDLTKCSHGVVKYPSASGMAGVDAPYYRLVVWGRSVIEYDINRPSSISCLVSIGIYLRNE